MGYRSELAFAVTHRLKEEILEKAPRDLSGEELAFVTNILAGKGVDAFSRNKHGIYVHFSSIRWYLDSGCQAAKMLEDFMSAHYSESRFVRIGEDLDDYDIYGDFDRVKLLDISRHIAVVGVPED